MVNAETPLRRSDISCHIVHALPGRLRLRVPWIKDQTELSQRLATFVSSWSGIRECEANAGCASVTLHYDAKQWSSLALCRKVGTLTSRMIRRLPVVKALPTNDAPQDSSWFQLTLSSAGIALGWLCEPLTPFLLPLLLAGSALPMVRRAYDAFVREGRLTVDVLDASATALLGSQGQFHMATFMVWLINLGDFIRDATVSQARAAVESVLSYQESSAWVVKGQRKLKVPVERIAVGDTVVVYPGDRIPVDGFVLSGKASVDQRTLTGESMPVDKEKGARVFASTVLHEGQLYIQTVHTGHDTEAAKIVHLVEQAPAHETVIQNYAERWANELVPYSFMGAGMRGMSASGATGAASVLVIDYGTGIRIAAPTTVLAIMTKAARQGILFKGGRVLEQLATVDAVVFDKTGTLTTGLPKVSEIQAYGSIGTEKVLALAAAAEQRLNHPVAQAIVQAATDARLTIPARKSSDYTIGLGVEARVNGYTVHVGCMRYMNKMGIHIPLNAKGDLESFGRRAVSPVCVSKDGTLIGLIGYTDQLRPEAVSVVEKLKQLGIKEIVMLTGDHPDVTQNVAAQLGISRYAAEVLPGQKVQEVKDLKRRGYRVAVVGDGINDSPALAHADVGIAVKGGADVAQETAHVVLMNGDLHHIPMAIELARETVDLIEENWRIISIPNTVALALACCGMLGPAGATLLSNGSAIVATGNALRPLWNGNGTVPGHNNDRIARSIKASVTDRAMA
jgi:heavy metal translocating P-type ATPase